MAKELPYFRFTVQEWQNGNISLESYELKGLFIEVCGFFWIRNCEVNYDTLNKRFSDAEDGLQKLMEIGCIKVDQDGNWITIDFLYEQYKILTKKQRKLSKAGKLGGIASAKARVKQKVKQPSSYKDKDKDKDKDNRAMRSLSFHDNVMSYTEYDNEMLTSFYEYWSEPNRSKTKMKCELEKTWDTNRRLKTWASREKNFKGVNYADPGSTWT